MNSRNMNITKNIAFINNDNKKTELIEWSYFNKDVLMPHKIIAIGNAGSILEGTLNKSVSKLPTGILGYQELSDMIVAGEVDIIILFGQAPEIQPDAKGFELLLETALRNNIIIAQNRGTTDFVLTSVLMNKNYSISVPDNSIQLKTTM
jgi:methylglyoxal synthase